MSGPCQSKEAADTKQIKERVTMNEERGPSYGEQKPLPVLRGEDACPEFVPRNQEDV